MSRIITSLAFVVCCGGSTSHVEPSRNPTSEVQARVDRVDGPAAHELVSKGAVLVDVRSPEEFAEKHIDGALNVPLDAVASHDFGGKDTILVLYCRSGHRSEQAATELVKSGYRNVHLLGAMSAWGN